MLARLLAPTLPLNCTHCNYPDIVTFHLFSGDLRGGNDKSIPLKKAMWRILFFLPFLKKHFSGHGLAREGEKK